MGESLRKELAARLVPHPSLPQRLNGRGDPVCRYPDNPGSVRDDERTGRLRRLPPHRATQDVRETGVALERGHLGAVCAAQLRAGRRCEQPVGGGLTGVDLAEGRQDVADVAEERLVRADDKHPGA